MQYSYDDAGNLTGINYADGTGTHYTLTPEGLVATVTNARGQTETFSYDDAGRLIRDDYSDGSFTQYAYDDHGNLKSARARDGGQTNYTYDSADRLTSVTDPKGRTESYVYDAGGGLIERDDPDGTAAAYSYDTAGNLTELRDGSGALLVKYGYDTAGRLIREDTGSGASTLYTYDAADNVTEILDLAADGSVVTRLNYTYDANARVTSETTLDGAWAYEYDAAGQLTHGVFTSTNATVANQDLTYVYDAAGNRTRTVENGVTTNYVTNSVNQYDSVGARLIPTTPMATLSARLRAATIGHTAMTRTIDSSGSMVRTAPGPMNTTRSAIASLRCMTACARNTSTTRLPGQLPRSMTERATRPKPTCLVSVWRRASTAMATQNITTRTASAMSPA